MFGGRTSDMNHKCYQINVENLHTGYSCQIPVLDQPIICGSIPSLQKGPWTLELAERGTHATDIDCVNSQFDLLIGSDFAGNIYTGKIQKLRTSIFAMETKLGWVLMGKSQTTGDENSIAALVSSLSVHNQEIRNLWELEAIGIRDSFEWKSRDEIDKVVKDHFMENLRKDSEGRYEVKLPWM
ncbi:putative tick transposon [Trichonephila clavipes]|nr:putative tick transposon [Trichonephila clavipes]